MTDQQMPARIWVAQSAGWVSDPCGTIEGDVKFIRADIAERIAESLEKAVKLAKLAEGLASCSADDEYVWGLQEEFESTLSAFRSATQDTEARHD